jgi:hypothetical protein
MRTKTLALSALIGMLGSASVMAQNVYSLNTVGYINATFPASSYTVLTVPLIVGVDANGVTNSLNVVLPNSVSNGAAYKHALVYLMQGGIFTTTESGVGTSANTTGWNGGGSDISLVPGVAVSFYNSTGSAMSATFVGQVPQSNIWNMTNVIPPGYNMVGSMIPASGDISTNPCMALTNMNKHDYVYTFDPTNGGFSAKDVVTAANQTGSSGYNNEWGQGDPVTDQVYYGFYYWNNQKTANLNWVENYSINP